MSEPERLIREWIEQTTWNMARLREQQIQLAIQPRPRWLPVWLWHRLLARLLVLEETDTP